MSSVSVGGAIPIPILTAAKVVSATPCRLLGITIYGGNGSTVASFFDNATTNTGTILATFPWGTTFITYGQEGVQALNGIYWAGVAITAGTVYIAR
jgi:hypothetical protein